MATNLFTKKFAALVALAGLFMFSGVVMFQLEVAFGWTNPAANPPGGSGVLTAATTGNVTRLGINTPTPTTANLVITQNPPAGPAIDVDPSGAATGKIIGLTPLPLLPDEAASKAYVDTQVAGAAGGGKPIVTIYGVTNANPMPWAQYTNGIVNFKNCLLGNRDACAQLTTAQGINPNSWNVLTCPAGWSGIWNGYGPYAYINRSYFYRTTPTTVGGNGFGGAARADDGEGDGPVDPTMMPLQHLPNTIAGITYSVCGKEWFQVAQTDYTILNYPGGGGIGGAAGIVSACIPQAGISICNICKICQQQ